MAEKSEQDKWLEDAQKRFEAEMKKLPEVSDKDFMDEFEASDEEYEKGFVLPTAEGPHGD